MGGTTALGWEAALMSFWTSENGWLGLAYFWDLAIERITIDFTVLFVHGIGCGALPWLEDGGCWMDGWLGLLHASSCNRNFCC